MPLSAFTSVATIGERSEATPGLFNRIFSIVSQNVDQMNIDASIASIWIRSGSTVTMTPVSLNAVLRSYDSGGAVYNVRAFGAVGNGVTNDYPSINTAMSAASAGGGGAVYFPPGVYSLAANSLDIPSRVMLCGSGFSSIISSSARAINTGDGVGGRNPRYITVRDLYFDCSSHTAGATTELQFNRGEYITVERCYLRNFWQFGIVMDGCRYTRVLDNFIDSGRSNQNSIELLNDFSDGFTDYHALVSGNICSGFSQNHDIEVLDGRFVAITHNSSQSRGFTVFRSQDVVVANNVIGRSLVIYTNSSSSSVGDVVVANNHIINGPDDVVVGTRSVSSGEGAIEVSSGLSARVIITGNIIRRSRDYGIKFRSNGQNPHNIVANNVVHSVSVGSAGLRNGIYLDDCTLGAVTGNTVSRVSIGIVLGSNAEATSVTGNRLSDCSDTAIRVESRRNSITGNVVQNCGFGVYLPDGSTTSNQVIASNVFDSITTQGIYAGTNSDYLVITGNLFSRMSQGIRVLASTNTNSVIADNAFQAISVSTANFSATNIGSVRDNVGMPDWTSPSLLTAGSAILPATQFLSEVSLGWFRSAASTMALSYGTLTLPSVLSQGGTHFIVGAGVVAFTAGNNVLQVRDNAGGIIQVLNVAGGTYTNMTYDALSHAFSLSGVANQANLNTLAQLLTVSGTAIAPSKAFTSENSLGFYRSGVSTMALSYGSFNLNQARTVSMRTLAASSLTPSAANTNTIANECGFTVGGASGASFWINSGGTTYIFNSAISAANA